jgi:hypothetical protein
MRFTAPRITMLAAALSFAVAAAPAAAQEPPPGPSGGTEATVDRPGLTVRPAALLDRTMRINGLTDAGDAGRAVTIDRQDLTGPGSVSPRRPSTTRAASPRCGARTRSAASSCARSSPARAARRPPATR